MSRRIKALFILLWMSLCTISIYPLFLIYGDYTKGDRWVYSVRNLSTGRSWNESRTIIEVYPNNFTLKIEYSDSKEQEFIYYTRNWVLIKKVDIEPELMVVHTYLPGFILYDIPLEIGKTWLSDYEEQLFTTIYSNPSANRTGFDHRTFMMSVVGTESIKLYNESYLIYIINYNYTFLGANVLWYQYWFSPDLNANVKEMVFSPGGAVFEEHELIEWEILNPPEKPKFEPDYSKILLFTSFSTAMIILVMIGLRHRRRR